LWLLMRTPVEAEEEAVVVEEEVKATLLTKMM
jgi:hypothetical protein